jgi:cob(I)alamin adenosyltransferase
MDPKTLSIDSLIRPFNDESQRLKSPLDQMQRQMDAAVGFVALGNELKAREKELDKREQDLNQREGALKNLQGNTEKYKRQASEESAKLEALRTRVGEAEKLALKLDSENEAKILRGKALDAANQDKASTLGARIAQEVLAGK